MISHFRIQALAYLLIAYSAPTLVGGLGIHIDVELPPELPSPRHEAHAPATPHARSRPGLASSTVDDFILEFAHGKHRGDFSVRPLIAIIRQTANNNRMMVHISPGRTFHMLLLQTWQNSDGPRQFTLSIKKV